MNDRCSDKPWSIAFSRKRQSILENNNNAVRRHRAHGLGKQIRELHFKQCSSFYTPMRDQYYTE